MTSGQPLTATPNLGEWTFRHFEAGTPDRRFAPFRHTARGAVVPDGVSGDIELAAFSIQMGERKDMIYSIRLAGPTLTVVN